MKRKNMILNKKASKNSIIVTIIFSLLNLSFLVYFLILVTEMVLNPGVNYGYLYTYGSSNDSRNFAFIILAVIILYLLVLSFIILKKKINYSFTIISIILIMPIIFFCGLGMLITYIRQSGDFCSYTTDINDYQLYDKNVDEYMFFINYPLPTKEDIVKYEYFFSKSFIADSFSVYIKINYNEKIYQEICNNELWEIQDITYDNRLTGYECYQYDFEIVYMDLRFLCLINKIDNSIVYAIGNRITFTEYYPTYIGAFINGDRNNPYFIYERKYTND